MARRRKRSDNPRDQYEELLAERLDATFGDGGGGGRQVGGIGNGAGGGGGGGGSRRPTSQDFEARDRAMANRTSASRNPSVTAAGFGGLADAARRAGLEAGLKAKFADMFAVDLPPMPQVAIPSLASYVKPYDDATALANQVYGESVPVINNVYDDLAANLTSSQQQQVAAAEQARGLAAQQQAAMLGAVQAGAAPTTLDQSLGIAGSDSAAAREAAVTRAFLDLRGADQAQLSQNMQQSAAELAAGRQQDASAMRAGSLGTARTNLDAILTQLGMGRAQAERQHAQDASQAQAQNAGAAVDYAKLKQQMQADQLSMMQEAEAQWADQNEKIAQKALSSGRAQWESRMDARMQRYPAAFEAMSSIIDSAGAGPLGRAQALQALAQNAANLSSGDNPSGKKLNVDVLAQWINEYYDDTEYVDPQLFGAMGGDPSYLKLRDRYQGG